MKRFSGLLCLWLYISSCQSNSSLQFANGKSENELRQELKQKEQQDFGKYITGNYQTRKNIIGEQIVEGTLTNTADLSTFKDVVLEVTFLSKTQTPLNVQNHIVYELLTPKKSVAFKIKTIAPSATQGCSMRIINATPVEN